MELLHGLEGLRGLPAGVVVSIGNFDGVHRGHRGILDVARAHDAGSGVAVVTFEPHPVTVLRPEAAPPRLTHAGLKRRLLEEAGVTYLVELPPTHEVLDLAAEQFWAILRDEVRPSHLVEGKSFYFGKGRGGDVAKLREWTASTPIGLHVVESVEVPLLDLSVVPVSSSLVRWLLAQGRVRDAAICLGRAYVLEGEVVKGYQRGRTIGVPTANLRPEGQVVPTDGVYVGRCDVGGRTYPAAVSIGTMPTLGEGQNRQVEAHLIGFGGDLYGKTIAVQLLDWLREQVKYPSIEALQAQMQRDLAETVARAGLDPARAVAVA